MATKKPPVPKKVMALKKADVVKVEPKAKAAEQAPEPAAKETKPVRKPRKKLEAPVLIRNESAKTPPKAPTKPPKVRNRVDRLLKSVMGHLPEETQKDTSPVLQTRAVRDLGQPASTQPQEPSYGPETVNTTLEESSVRAKRVVKRRPTREGTIGFDDIVQAQNKQAAAKPGVPAFVAGIDFTQHLKK